MENDTLYNPNPLKTVSGRCSSPDEALEYQQRLGTDHGVTIKISEVDPKIIQINELDQGAIGPNLFGSMDKILIDRYHRELALEKEAQTNVLQPPVTSQVQVNAVAAPAEDESFFYRLWNHVTTFFKPPAKPLRSSGQSV